MKYLQGIKFIPVIIIFSLLINCTDKPREEITNNDLEKVARINDAIKGYYFSKQKLPVNISDLEKFYEEENIDSIFQIKIQGLSKVQYVPVFKNNSTTPIEYFLVSSKNKLKPITKSNEQEFLNNAITVCEYNNGKNGDIILSNSNGLLLSRSRNAFHLKKAFSSYWKTRIYYNVIFNIDSLTQYDKDLSFIAYVDSIKIRGQFYNNNVKRRIQEETLTKDSIVVEGFKIRNLAQNEILLTDVNIHTPQNVDTIFGKYFNEVGELENYKYLKGCDSIPQ